MRQRERFQGPKTAAQMPHGCRSPAPISGICRLPAGGCSSHVVVPSKDEWIVTGEGCEGSVFQRVTTCATLRSEIIAGDLLSNESHFHPLKAPRRTRG